MPQDRAQNTSDDGVQPRCALNATKRFFKRLLKDLQYSAAGERDRQVAQLRRASIATRSRIAACEPPRVSRRLQLLRGWSHDEARREPFSPEVRERAVRMVLEHGASTPRNGRRSARSRRRSAARARRCATGCARPSATRGCGPGRPRDERERIKALEREDRELRQANEILRKASAYFAMAELDRRSRP